MSENTVNLIRVITDCHCFTFLSQPEYQRAPYALLKHYRFYNGKMNGRGKDYDAFAHLRPFPNIVGSYKRNIIEASIRITL